MGNENKFQDAVTEVEEIEATPAMENKEEKFEDEKDEEQKKADDIPATRQSADTKKGELGRCWNCESQGLVERAHTYSPNCQRCIEGATLAQMKQAARGGAQGRRNVLAELAAQRKSEEQKAKKADGAGKL